MALGILSALLDEQRALVDQLVAPQRSERGGRTFWRGSLFGHAVVLATSGIGKVAAAAATTAMIEAFEVDRLVFTGVAGDGFIAISWVAWMGSAQASAKTCYTARSAAAPSSGCVTGARVRRCCSCTAIRRTTRAGTRWRRVSARPSANPNAIA